MQVKIKTHYFKTGCICAIIFFVIGFVASLYFSRNQIRNYRESAIAVNQQLRASQNDLRAAIEANKRLKTSLSRAESLNTESGKLNSGISTGNTRIETGLNNLQGTIGESGGLLSGSLKILRDIQKGGR